VVCNTYRWRGHSKSDRNLYRTDEEIKEWQERDPIRRFREHAASAGLLTEEAMDEIKEEAYASIESATEFAENSPEPSVDTIEEGVYAP
jgi:pyruvate dehydrogenase E1 component alpha subunit